MLSNGYYISIYSSVNAECHAMKAVERHDQNMSLWKHEDGNVVLIRHWEFERITGFKHHGFSFKNKRDIEFFINSLLKEIGLSLLDITGIFGTPEISNLENYHDFQNSIYSYHGLAHLYSSILMDTEIFHQENILAFTFDGGSDQVSEKKQQHKVYANWRCV